MSSTTEAEVHRWLASRPQPTGIELVSVEDGASTLSFSRSGAGEPVEVVLSPVEGASFFVEGLGEPPEEVEEWLTTANSLFSDKPRLSLTEALAALCDGAPRLLRAHGDAREESQAMELDDDEGDLELEAEDDVVIHHVDESREAARAVFSEQQMWESMVKSSSSQGSRQASQVLMREMRKLLALKGEGDTRVLEINMVDDSLYRWCAKMPAASFPDSCSLKRDLQNFAAKNPSREAAVVFEIVFPRDYPMKPPFIRVVRPRFEMHTGHVTVGGSICMESLTPSGWLPTVSLENLFVSIQSEMIEGGGRLVAESGQRDYSMMEAEEAFQRIASRYGWLKPK
eukprot:TRINITY_DN55153_c0_g1_i1.p1 TRINITY_DN55153_c0_g1~~TRINITY_DN55153_c0_g1_i1.p1  ORF type:complete len:341 (-),score=63.02 TRINITY_DN55153_c0_g1_i1:86-1108(-)